MRGTDQHVGHFNGARCSVSTVSQYSSGGNNEGRQRKRIRRKALGVVPSTPPFLPPCELGASCFSSSPSLRLPSPGHRMSSALPSPLAEAIGRKLSTWKGWVQRGKTQNCMFRMMDVMQSMLTARKKKKSWQTMRATPVTDCMFVFPSIPSRTFGGR